MTCFGVIELAAQSVVGSDECAGSLAELESMCCPPMVDPPMVKNPCLVCLDGATFDREVSIEGSIMTCSEGIDSSTMYESGSDECTTRQGYLEPMCCPPKVENPCLVCPNGATVDAAPSEFLGNTMTCPDATEYATIIDSGADEWASSFAELEPMCCPLTAENPCLVCPDGTTFDGKIEVEVGTFQTLTCSDMVSFVARYELGSEECTSSEADFRPLCCPPKVENPCMVCPNGANFSDMVDVEGVTLTCSGMISLVALYESGSDECTESLADLEPMCCPIPAENTTVVLDDATFDGVATILSIDAASSGEAFSGFGGFAFISVVWAVYAVWFV
jgi:hypothetical protein